jgi:molybdate transport system ATP-binding protein
MTLDAALAVEQGAFSLALELVVGPGEVTAILGPNGSGKTTTLRALAGTLGRPAGRIHLDGRALEEADGAFVPAEARNIGFVHQDLLLFPHLSAIDNVAFGLRARGAARKAARAEAVGWLDRVGLADVAAARPAALSGGQAQRVALARTLATRPGLLLLDEPLSALDPSTRTAMRRDLRSHLGDFAGPTVLVTHDPLDALTLATDIVVLEDGRPTQVGPLRDVVARPRTPYVADLLGTNLLRGTGVGTAIDVAGGGVVEVAEPVSGDVFATFPPRAVTLHAVEPRSTARNLWAVEVAEIELSGDRARVHLDGPISLVAEATPRALSELGLHPGAAIWASVKATEVDVYPM